MGIASGAMAENNQPNHRLRNTFNSACGAEPQAQQNIDYNIAQSISNGTPINSGRLANAAVATARENNEHDSNSEQGKKKRQQEAFLAQQLHELQEWLDELEEYIEFLHKQADELHKQADKSFERAHEIEDLMDDLKTDGASPENMQKARKILGDNADGKDLNDILILLAQERQQALIDGRRQEDKAQALEDKAREFTEKREQIIHDTQGLDPETKMQRLQTFQQERYHEISQIDADDVAYNQFVANAHQDIAANESLKAIQQAKEITKEIQAEASTAASNFNNFGAI